MATRTRYLYPTAFTETGTGLSGVVTSIDEPYDAPNDLDFVTFAEPGSTYFTAAFDPLPPTVIGIVSVRAVARAIGDVLTGPDLTDQNIKIGDASSVTSFLAATTLDDAYANYAGTRTTNPSTGLAYTPADVNAIRAIVTISHDDGVTSTSAYCTQLYLEVVTVEVPQGTEPTREAVSRRWWQRRRPATFADLAVPLAVGLAAELLELQTLAHILAPHETDSGWEPSKYQRRSVRSRSRTIVPGAEAGTNLLRLRVRDEDPFLALHYDSAWSPLSTAPPGEGIIRFDRGGTRTYTRTGPAWVEHPIGGRISQLEEDQELHGRYGDLFEAARTNKLLNSACSEGTGATFTSWTNTAGAGTLGEETTIVRADPSVSTRVMKFQTHATSHSSDSYRSQTIAKLAGETMVLSFDVCHTSSTALSWRAQRSVDSWYWNDTSGAWQAGAVWNALSAATLNEWTRQRSKAIAVGGSNTNVTVAIGFPNGSAAAKTAYVGWLQEETGAFPTSWIKTTSAAITRGAAQLLLANNSTSRRWKATQGAFGCEVIPWWSAADVTAQNKTVAYVGHDANNYEWIYFDGANARWVFERKVAGSTSRAVKSASPVAGATYLLGARWCSSEGEHGLGAYTISVFVDGVKGTDATPAAAPTEASTVNFEIGSKAGADNFDGRIRTVNVRQRAVNDTQVARLCR